VGRLRPEGKLRTVATFTLGSKCS